MSPNPNGLDDIIKIIAIGDNYRKQNWEKNVKFAEEQKVNQARIDEAKALTDYRDKITDLADKEFKSKEAQQSLINKAAEALSKAQNFATKLDLGARIDAGKTVPGDVTSKIFTMPGSEQFPNAGLPAMRDVQRHQVDMGNQTYDAVHYKPEIYAQKQAGLEEIQRGPETRAAEAVETRKAAGTAFNEATQQANKMELERLKIKAEKDKYEAEIKGRLDVANLRARGTGSDELGPEWQQLASENLEMGTTTTKKLLAEAGSPRRRDAIGKWIKQYQDAGGVDMNDEQQKSVEGFSKTFELLDKQADYIKVAPDIRSGPLITKAKLWIEKMKHMAAGDDVAGLHNAIESTGSDMAKRLGVTGTQSNKDTQSAVIGNAPGLNDTLDQSIRKVNTNMERALKDFYVTYRNYKGEALQRLEQRLGIDKIKLKHAEAVKRLQAGGQGINIPASQRPARKSIQQLLLEQQGLTGPEPIVKPSPMPVR